ncbi:MAG: DUF1501 domain-containing protein [SAR324 cluster bacterium]|nr:DUF1501 domain-containing protein [SAR324 cluster bacterium]MDP7317825.1 DUF1501 domain-containing protein [SAR324 cluster bacterium]MDP7629780.1 DUF1501 domain-containing protein [SAR324 cluster bacterium]
MLRRLAGGLLLPLVPQYLTAAAQQAGRRLVLVELSGANDGLNTVIPFQDHRYRELRPQIGIERQDMITLDSGFALHGAMRRVMESWDDGDLAILPGLGYPNPNRSHFKSIALWETGGDGNGSGRSGWLTQAVEGMPGTADLDAHGISLDGGMGVFASPSGIWLSMTSVAQFTKLADQPFPSYAETDNPALNLLLGRMQSLQTAMQRIITKLRRARHQRFRIDGNDFARQLSHTAILIDAGINAPVLKVQLGGFDTHENQTWRHHRLLRDLTQALAGFRRHLRQRSHWDNTLVLTYSEFGRRAVENQSHGTDHGTAAPHFLMGGRVNGGFYGTYPDLGDLDEGDLKYTMDYRAVYDRVLADWFGLPNHRFRSFRDSRLNSLIS